MTRKELIAAIEKETLRRMTEYNDLGDWIGAGTLARTLSTALAPSAGRGDLIDLLKHLENGDKDWYPL